jgi:hypothetical protein
MSPCWGTRQYKSIRPLVLLHDGGMGVRKQDEHKKKNSVVLVRKRTIPTKRPQPADEVSANFSW